MVLEFMGQGAFLSLVVLFVAGCCGLRMCGAMLRSQTALSLRQEAVLSIIRQESFCYLSTHQQAAVFRALSASDTPRERLTPQALLAGGHLKPCIN